MHFLQLRVKQIGKLVGCLYVPHTPILVRLLLSFIWMPNLALRGYPFFQSHGGVHGSRAPPIHLYFMFIF